MSQTVERQSFLNDFIEKYHLFTAIKKSSKSDRKKEHIANLARHLIFEVGDAGFKKLQSSWSQKKRIKLNPAVEGEIFKFDQKKAIGKIETYILPTIAERAQATFSLSPRRLRKSRSRKSCTRTHAGFILTNNGGEDRLFK